MQHMLNPFAHCFRALLPYAYSRKQTIQETTVTAVGVGVAPMGAEEGARLLEI